MQKILLPFKWVQTVFLSFPGMGCSVGRAAGASNGFPEGKPHRQQLCIRCDSSSVTWTGPRYKVFWYGCSVLCLVLVLKEQLRPEVKGTWFGKSFCLSCWELCCEYVKHYKTWSYHKTQLRGFPAWRSKAQGTDTSHCACPASPGASHSPGSLCQPSPWLSVPVPALLAPREQPALIAPWRKPFKRLDVSALIFHFMPCIYN